MEFIEEYLPFIEILFFLIILVPLYFLKKYLEKRYGENVTSLFAICTISFVAGYFVNNYFQSEITGVLYKVSFFVLMTCYLYAVTIHFKKVLKQ